MDIRYLRYFIACVENRTMHAAAEAVHISQPALSKAIANLEATLSVPLLDRRPRGVEPTPFGRTLYRYAKMIESDMRHAIAEIDAMRGMTRGEIVVGVIPSMGGFMSEVARDAMTQLPGLKLKFRAAFSNEIIAALLEGELDIALVLLPEGGIPPGLAFEPLMRTRPVVAARRGHPLADRERLGLADLAGYPWLFPQYPTTHHKIISTAFINAGIPAPTSAIEVSTIIFFNEIVRQSDLLTVVPSTMLADDKLGLVPLDIELAFPAENVGLAFRENSALLPGAQALMKIARKCSEGVPDYLARDSGD